MEIPSFYFIRPADRVEGNQGFSQAEKIFFSSKLLNAFVHLS